MTIEELRVRLVEHLAIRAYRTADGDPSLKALMEYEQAVIREARAKALEEAAEAAEAASVVAGVSLSREWLRDRAARERKGPHFSAFDRCDDGGRTKEEAMTPGEERDIREAIRLMRERLSYTHQTFDETAAATRLSLTMSESLLAALDATRAREARLREAAAEVVRQVLGDDPSWWTPERRPDAATMVTTKTLGLYDALSDSTATTWLADRERAAAVRALRWAAKRALFLTAEADTRRRTESWLGKHADEIEAGTEEVPRDR